MGVILVIDWFEIGGINWEVNIDEEEVLDS